MIKAIVLVSLLLIFESIAAAGINNILKGTSIKIKDPLELRDPFKRERRRGLRQGRQTGRMMVNNNFNNLPSIESISLDEIRIVGVLLGEKRRAIARIIDADGNNSSQDTYIIKEGMRLGLNKAEVKAILPGGVVLVEKIRNVYDQDEYIETVIPITTPLSIKRM